MIYWLGLGSNLGAPIDNLRAAVAALTQHGVVLARSQIFRSAPVGGPPQPCYLNAALSLQSGLDPLQLLSVCQEIERQQGRARASEVRWGARTLDIDVLLAGEHGEVIIDRPGLLVPHPRLHERGFALAPLVDLNRALVHPILGRSLGTLLEEVGREQEFAPIGSAL